MTADDGFLWCAKYIEDLIPRSCVTLLEQPRMNVLLSVGMTLFNEPSLAMILIHK
jgi:hypothetical protein